MKKEPLKYGDWTFEELDQEEPLYIVLRPIENGNYFEIGTEIGTEISEDKELIIISRVISDCAGLGAIYECFGEHFKIKHEEITEQKYYDMQADIDSFLKKYYAKSLKRSNEENKIIRLRHAYSNETSYAFWGIMTNKHSVEEIAILCSFLEHIRSELPGLPGVDDCLGEPECAFAISMLCDDCQFIEIEGMQYAWPEPDDEVCIYKAYETANLHKLDKINFHLSEASKAVVDVMIRDVEIYFPRYAKKSEYCTSTDSELATQSKNTLELLKRISKGEYIEDDLKLMNINGELYSGTLKTGTQYWEIFQK